MPRLPTAVLATGLMVLAFLSLTSGLILDTVTRGRWEAEAHGLSRHSRPAETSSDPVNFNRAISAASIPSSGFGIIGACGYAVGATRAARSPPGR